MTISEKDRKILWGRAASRCCYCKQELIIDKSDKDPHSVIGEECHIHGRRPDSARYSEDLAKDQIDKDDNLILLCRIHHKLVDDQPIKYTVTFLKNLKLKHENWVKSALNIVDAENSEWSFHFLNRVRTGKELMMHFSGTHSGIFDNDEPLNQVEAEELSDFMQEVQDVADVGDDVDLGEKTRWEWRISEQIRKLEEYEFLVFAKKSMQTVNLNNRIVNDWEVSVLKVAKSNTAGITEDGNFLALVNMSKIV